MKCLACGSENVTVNMVTERSKVRTNHTSILRVWGRRIMIFLTFGIWLLVPKRKENGKIDHKMKKVALCQSCGKSWNV